MQAPLELAAIGRDQHRLSLQESLEGPKHELCGRFSELGGRDEQRDSLRDGEGRARSARMAHHDLQRVASELVDEARFRVARADFGSDEPGAPLLFAGATHARLS